MDDQTVVDFEALELEEEGTEEGPSKMETLLSYVKEKLSEEDYSGLLKELGLEGGEMSNEELFEAIKALLKPKEETEEDETEMADQQAFMEECLKSGKTREDCLEEWKSKGDEPPAKEGGDEDPKLAGEVKELKTKIAELEKAADLKEVTAQVDQLISEKHLAPVQRKVAIKLASGLTEDKRDELYGFWEKTQRFNVSDDVGQINTSLPGTESEMTPERREMILEKHGLRNLILDKADRTKKLPWESNN
jgi:hypothetical protein